MKATSATTADSDGFNADWAEELDNSIVLEFGAHSLTEAQIAACIIEPNLELSLRITLYPLILISLEDRNRPGIAVRLAVIHLMGRNDDNNHIGPTSDPRRAWAHQTMSPLLRLFTYPRVPSGRGRWRQ